MIEHHIKYKEFHGYDETIWITWSEHKKINHRKLFPEVNVEELKIISNAANKRTSKNKIKQLEYYKNNINFYKNYRKKWSKNNKEKKSKYYKDDKRNIKHINFDETLMTNVKLREFIGYNNRTNNILISCGFEGKHSKKLFYIDID